MDAAMHARTVLRLEGRFIREPVGPARAEVLLMRPHEFDLDRACRWTLQIMV